MIREEAVSRTSRLGFVGLGHLGSRIARRLITAGFPMIVYDLDHSRAVEVARGTVEVAEHPRDLASKVDIVLSCLPDERSVLDVYL